MSEPSSFVKWIGGILSGVIVAVGGWWLTGPDSPIGHRGLDTIRQQAKTDSPAVPPPPIEKKPRLKISQFEIDNNGYVFAFNHAHANVQITNNGEGDANGCVITWTISAEISARSSEFGVPANSDHSLAIESPIIPTVNSFQTEVKVHCDNGDAGPGQKTLTTRPDTLRSAGSPSQGGTIPIREVKKPK